MKNLLLTFLLVAVTGFSSNLLAQGADPSAGGANIGTTNIVKSTRAQVIISPNTTNVDVYLIDNTLGVVTISVLNTNNNEVYTINADAATVSLQSIDYSLLPGAGSYTVEVTDAAGGRWTQAITVN